MNTLFTVLTNMIDRFAKEQKKRLEEKPTIMGGIEEWTITFRLWKAVTKALTLVNSQIAKGETNLENDKAITEIAIKLAVEIDEAFDGNK